MPRDRHKLARHWLLLAVAALAASGALSLGVVLSRVPAIARHLTETDVSRRILVVHVGLGIVVWFLALPVALFHLQRVTAARPRTAGSAGALAPWLATAGALILPSGLVPGLGTVHPVNYVPAIAHPLYGLGLGLFFAGVALSYLDRGTPAGAAPALQASPVFRLPGAVSATLATSGAVVSLAALHVLLAVAALAAALFRVPAGLDAATRLETVMWGPGHLLQFANVGFVVVAWALLAAWGTGRQAKGGLRWVVAALAVPLLPILLLLVRGPTWWYSRAGFVLLMQWGLFPAVLLFLALGLVPHLWRSARAAHARERDALWPLAGSVILMLVGFLYGAMIRGSDLRIPGHYHACIGAVTLAYMALALLLAGGSSERAGPLPLRRVTALYGAGQLVFATGLVIAGSYGLGRKTYGVEQHIGYFGQRIGLWVMAAGGVLAFAGGAVWAIAALRLLLGRAGSGESGPPATPAPGAILEASTH